jgi:hypothetical protein
MTPTGPEDASADPAAVPSVRASSPRADALLAA